MSVEEKSFETFEQEWTRVCERDPELLSMVNEKIPSLLLNEDQSFVRQGIALLVQLGGLVSILRLIDGTIHITERYIKNLHLIEMCVIEEVRLPSSEWHPLFKSGVFNALIFRCADWSMWDSLSHKVQSLLLEEARTTVPVPFIKVAIGKYAVTQALWIDIMGYNPSSDVDWSKPVHNVDWLSSIVFCNRLSERTGLEKVYSFPINFEQSWENRNDLSSAELDALFDGITQNIRVNGYRLPTDKEWFLAFKISRVDGKKHTIEETTWYRENSDFNIQPVARKIPNEIGVYDMGGNIAEWCWDVVKEHHGFDLAKEKYRSSLRVRRGFGVWQSEKAIGRRGMTPSRNKQMGFRVVRTLPSASESVAVHGDLLNNPMAKKMVYMMGTHWFTLQLEGKVTPFTWIKVLTWMVVLFSSLIGFLFLLIPGSILAVAVGYYVAVSGVYFGRTLDEPMWIVVSGLLFGLSSVLLWELVQYGRSGHIRIRVIPTTLAILIISLIEYRWFLG